MLSDKIHQNKLRNFNSKSAFSKILDNLKALSKTNRCIFCYRSLFNFFIFFLFFHVAGYGSPESTARRLQAHLLIGDPKSAATEGLEALQHYPNEAILYEWTIKSLAALGEDFKMMEIWEKFTTVFEQRPFEQDLLEDMCWGILKKGKETHGTSSQLICLIGAALTQDMRALPFLLNGLRHTNAQIRAISVELAAHYGDHPLREEIARLFREEKALDVRIKVIKALAKLQLEIFLPDLIECIANPKTSEKEKQAAIEAIVQMRRHMGREELAVLASSRRAGLRQLACEVIATCLLEEESNLLSPLIRDSQSEVSAAAIKAWGLLRKEATEEIKSLAQHALDPLVGITAAWVWLLDDSEEGAHAMIQWLEHEKAHVRALAASAVAASGPYGVALARKALEKATDQYVQINLSLALAKQREECQLVCKVLEEALQNNQDRWMLSENGIFNAVEKSNINHSTSIPNYPEVINQTVRLEVLNLLAILESPKALASIKNFLKERQWKVTGLAAEMLLGEGDEAAIDLVQELLNDPDYEIRLEAALALAFWGRDPKAITTLLEVYPKADRQLQLKILESLGRIGDKKTIPFLLQRLKDPSLVLRMVAASILIQTLNH